GRRAQRRENPGQRGTTGTSVRLAAVLYGSLAKGSARTASDVDVLVVGSVTSAEVLSAMTNAQPKRLSRRDRTQNRYRGFALSDRRGMSLATASISDRSIFSTHEIADFVTSRASGPTKT